MVMVDERKLDEFEEKEEERDKICGRKRKFK